MDIRIGRLLEGADRAEGLTVIIDVFRAFSVEGCLFAAGAEKVFPVGDIEEAYAMKREHPDWLLIGERGGRKCEGFDYGNSPSELEGAQLAGRCAVHTTSAGTQGLAAAEHAEELLCTGLLNARATAEYILRRAPETVSLIAMGFSAKAAAEEDELCAEYIRSILLGEPLPDMDRRTAALQERAGWRFLDPAQTDFPEPDFWACIRYDRFPFAMKVDREGKKMTARPVCTDGSPWRP